MSSFIDADARTGLRTVLYVEDHPVNVLLMQALLAKRPRTRLVVATTGEEGLRHATAQHLDLLLLDLRLPDMHGTELLQHLRRLPSLARTPAVAVTAEDTRGLAGFVEVWHKPMDLHATLLRLDRLLGSAHPHADLRGEHATPMDDASWTDGSRRRAAPQPIPFPSGPVHAAEFSPRDSFNRAL